MIPRFYRPLSLLPVVGRIVKSLKAKQLHAYRETLEIIPPEMDGYRSNMGTTTALLEIGEHVEEKVSNGKLVCLLYGHLS